MKKSYLNRYALLLLICWISGSVAIDLCRHNRNIKIISIFNFGKDIILQTNDTNSGNVIEFRRITNLNGYLGKWASNELEEYLFKDGFLPTPSDLQDLNTRKNWIHIDKFQRIFGYVTPINVSWAIQGQPNPVLSDPMFTEFKFVVDSDYMSFVCIHGIKVWTTDTFVTRVFKYDSQEPALKAFINQELEQLLLKSCMNNTIQHRGPAYKLEDTLPRLVSLVNWPVLEGSQKFYNNITLIEYVLVVGKFYSEVKLMALERDSTIITDTWIESVLDFSFYSIFRFNDYYKYMVCGKQCDLYSHLYWVTLEKNRRNQSQLNFRRTRISIRKLFGCASTVAVSTFDPSSFCDKSREFMSVFSLGEDVYFQRSGRFWRYSHNRFTEESNPLLNSGNKYQIRLESHFTTLVEKGQFDTTLPLLGFSFDGLDYDSCGHSDTECNLEHTKSGDYFRVCLFGKATKQFSEGFGSTNWQRGYIYTPSGLAKFQRIDLFLETDDFCKSMWADMPGVNSITSLRDRFSYYNYVVALVSNRENVVIYTWFKGSLIFSVDVKKTMNRVETKTPPIFLYTMKGLIDLKVSEGTIEQKVVDGMSGGPKTLNQTLKLSTLLNCPFNTSLSLVTLKRETVCQKTKTNSVESVFSIGPRIYHQIGQHFYAFDNKIERFLYDRVISDLFHHYFDTTNKVTAYSVRVKLDGIVYEVVVHGMSAHNFKQLGQYIFALFTLNISSVSPVLKALKRSDDSWHELNETLGILNHHLSQFEPIDCMGIMGQIVDRVEEELIWIKEDKLNGVFIITKEEAVRQLFAPTSSLWRSDWGYLANLSFDRLLGMYSYGLDGLNLVAHSKKHPEKVMIYGMTGLYPQKTVVFKTMKDYKEFGDYHLIFCQTSEVLEQKSESPSDLKTLSSILAVLLLILLILALLIGFFVYNMNQKKESIDSMEKPKSVENLESNGQNNTVVRQPESNIDSKEVQNS